MDSTLCSTTFTDGQALRVDTSDDVVIAEAREEEAEEESSVFTNPPAAGGGKRKAVLTVSFVKKFIRYAKAKMYVGEGSQLRCSITESAS
jgi:hypothetical protein